MKLRLVSAAAIFIVCGPPASAHRLDEYLQATIISVEKDRVQAQIHLTPGVAVFPIVFANIDTDGDGVISEAEQQVYAGRVLRDLSLTIDGDRLPLRLLSLRFAKTEDMKEGRGEIQLDFTAHVPRSGVNRRLIFENHHQSRIGAYLVNCLVPRDPDIHVTGQDRDYQQSFYRLDYVQTGVHSGPLSFSWWSGGRGWLGVITLFLCARLAWLLRRHAGLRLSSAAVKRAGERLIARL